MRHVIVAVVVVMLVAVIGGSTAAPAGAVSAPSRPHVYLIIGENTELTQVDKNNAPYLLGTLKPQGRWLTNYFALTHFSEANYIGMTAGQFNHCQQFDGSAAACLWHEDWYNQMNVATDGATPVRCRGRVGWSRCPPRAL